MSDDLLRQGNLLYSARQRRAERPTRGVLSLRRLQSLERPGILPCHRRLPFCDTDFVGVDGAGGGKFQTAAELAAAIAARWPTTALPQARPYVVCTGGEPLLQLNEPLIEAMHACGFEVPVETNGTLAPPPGLDWICVSPKANAPLLLRQGQEFKLVYPQAESEARPERFVHLDFQYFFLQPLDDPHLQENTQAALRYCLEHLQWRLSLQTHKILHIP